jgi:hypothetical protein
MLYNPFKPHIATHNNKYYIRCLIDFKWHFISVEGFFYIDDMQYARPFANAEEATDFYFKYSKKIKKTVFYKSIKAYDPAKGETNPVPKPKPRCYHEDVNCWGAGKNDGYGKCNDCGAEVKCR